MGQSWASAAHPSNQTCSFAVAADNGSFVIDSVEDDWKTECIDAEMGAAYAVEWHGEDIVFRGDQLGAVRLWDMRTTAEKSEPRIQFQSTINYVRSINENLVVVAGQFGQVSNVPSYDANLN